MWSAIVLVLELFCVCFDVNYFLRISYLLLLKRLRKAGQLSDTSVIYGFSLSLIDLAGQHMNNARYHKDLEFARYHFLQSSGLCDVMKELKVKIVQSAANIRYRKAIPVLSLYKVTTKIIYWDSAALYLEHNFITLCDNFIRATVLTKEILPDKALAVLSGGGETKLKIPRDLELWLRSMETSNDKLRTHSA